MFRHDQPPVDDDPPDLVKICLEATIGMTYHRMLFFRFTLSSRIDTLSATDPIFIAARLRHFTVSTTQNTPFDPMDLTVPVTTQSDNQKQNEWDSRNDECTVEISQVFLRFDGSTMGAFLAFEDVDHSWADFIPSHPLTTPRPDSYS